MLEVQQFNGTFAAAISQLLDRPGLHLLSLLLCLCLRKSSFSLAWPAQKKWPAEHRAPKLMYRALLPETGTCCGLGTLYCFSSSSSSSPANFAAAMSSSAAAGCAGTAGSCGAKSSFSQSSQSSAMLSQCSVPLTGSSPTGTYRCSHGNRVANQARTQRQGCN